VARQIITMITDDLDGGEASETLTFALDGMSYEIDLNSENASKLRDFMSTYIEAGTRTGRVGSGAQLQRHRVTPVSSHPTFAENRQTNQAIRAWANANGYELAERGRIPQHIVDAYHQGRSNPQAQQKLLDEQAAENDKQLPPKARNAKKAAPVSFTPEKVPA
jgi:hypothetical protein